MDIMGPTLPIIDTAGAGDTDIRRIEYDSSGKNSKEIVKTYFIDPSRFGAVVIPTATEHGKTESGFHPDAPQRMLIDSHMDGPVREVWTPGSPEYRRDHQQTKEAMSQPYQPQVPQYAQPQANAYPSSLPPSVTQAPNVQFTGAIPTQAEHQFPGPMVQQAPAAIPMARPTFASTASQPSFQARPEPISVVTPALKVEFYRDDMIFPAMYHEVLMNAPSEENPQQLPILVLIWDLRCTTYNPPPRFQINPADKPFKIKFKQYLLSCCFDGIAFTSGNREFTVFRIDTEQSQELSNGQGQPSQGR